MHDLDLLTLCVAAFLQMLENPMAANQWLNDPDTGPILMQVSRIYQVTHAGGAADVLAFCPMFKI
jgi:hypothetical protein